MSNTQLVCSVCLKQIPFGDSYICVDVHREIHLLDDDAIRVDYAESAFACHEKCRPGKIEVDLSIIPEREQENP